MTLVEQMNEINKNIPISELRSELENLGLVKPIVQEPRFTKIEDSQGSWIRDNQTGIEYSREIGLHLIDH